MKVGFLQTAPEFGRVKKNVEHMFHLLEGIDVELLVLPELFNTGYQFAMKDEVKHLSEEVPDGFTTQALIYKAKEKGLYTVAGIAERVRDRYFNSAILVGPKGFIGVYRKVHLFDMEKLWFSPGEDGFPVFDIGKARVGLMVCFDWLFPEVARVLALEGADIICHPSNLVLPYCPEAMITRCLENRVFAITANRIGKEERIPGKPLTFIGKSQVISPKGEILYRASEDKEEANIIEIRHEEARDKMITPENHIFRDRRKELYGAIT
ncbi:MAG: acyltransferase [Deltaproteobacteria bacterium]|nr:acyltransferase [Deltaproteobacteria bacterium]